jgi:hypothetical protein
MRGVDKAESFFLEPASQPGSTEFATWTAFATRSS